MIDATNFDFGSIFYILMNGWYLGGWGDYGSCLMDVYYGSYVMVTIDGDYDMKNQAVFTRGAMGKYRKFSTGIGLCVPYQCQEDDLVGMT